MESDAAQAAALELLGAAQEAMVLRAFVRLGVPDRLAQGELAVEDLAAALGAAPSALTRLLRAAEGLGLCRLTGPGMVELTAVGATFRASAEGRFAEWAELMTAPWIARAWESLDDAVRSGKGSFERVHGVEFWAYVATHADEAAAFDRMMSSAALGRAHDLRDALEWTDVGTVVDIGGGQGRLLATLLAAAPALRGVSLDRAEVVASPAPEAAALGERLSLVAGDMFTAVPPGGDVYVLSRILHDWADTEALSILRAVRAAMRPGARLCVLEDVVPEGSAAPTPRDQLDLAIKDLNMLVLVGGQERTRSEYADILGRAGLTLTDVHEGESCDVMVAVAKG